MSTASINSPANWRRAKDPTWVVCGLAWDVLVGLVTVQKTPSVGRGNRSERDERRNVPDRCTDCGGLLSDWGRRGASVPGDHFDCA